MIKKYLHKILFFAVAFFCIANASIAQYASEDELKVAADKFFEEEKYVEALPLFSQLLSLYPKDVNYNYKYGASVLFGSRDKDDALKFLKFSVTKSTVDPIANYFLAKAYHHNYQFAPAQVYYIKFKEKASTKELQKYDIDNEIKMCKSGENLIKSMTDIGVLSKKEIKATDFFRSYELKGIGGKIIVKPDEFKTKLDKKNNENSIIYLGESKNTVVFSSYGNNGSTGKDIYKVVKLPSGEWSKPTPIGDGINTSLDEDYPFLHPNGRTLYFSSKGYNSMGGYDIFKSTLDANGNWSFPENLDFPINTPDDDILYISDIDNELAYFASSRESKQGELTVYNVTVDAPPVENSVVKGFFLAESNPSMKSATITIRDIEKDRRYGVYKTHQETGEYLLVFPSNGGKFKILVETTNNAPIHSAVIELPVLDGFRALKQELRLVGEGDSEKLVVKNLFDESDEFDIHDPLVVEHILKQRAKLEVNTTKEEIQNATKNAVVASNETGNNKYEKLSNAQVANAANEKSTKIIEQTDQSKTQANTSYALANQKSTKAKALYNESEKLLAEAKNSTSESEKQQKIALAESKKMEAAKLINETVAALNMARTLDNELTERKSDVATVKTLQEKINTNIDNGNRSDAETNLAKLDEIAAATYHNESALVAEEKLLNDKLSEKKVIYNKARDKVTELTNREYELKAKADKLEEQKKGAKKKSEIADLEAQLKVLNIDIEDNGLALDNAKTKAASSKTEYTKAINEVETYKTVVSKVVEGNNKATISESSKLQLENDIKYFEDEGMVGVYPSDEVKSNNIVSNETYSLAEHKDEYNIIGEDGKIVDYNTTFSSDLSKLDAVKDPAERAKLIMKINQSWIENIDEEIKLRNEQLKVETNPANKSDLQNKVNSLQSLKAAKLKEIADNEVILANNANTINNSSTASNNTNSNNTTSTNVSANTEEVNIMNTDGSIIDYPTNYTKKLSTYTKEDTYETYKEKAAIHNDWASATEQEILIRKMELVEANEVEKNDIQNKIAILENNLAEQKEFIALYDAQAASVEPIELATNTNNTSLTNNETNNTTSNNNETNISSTNTTSNNVNTSNESNTNEISNNETNNSQTIDLSQFNVVNTDGTVKDYSSNYENKIAATNSQTNSYSKNIEQSNLTKEWINAIDEEINYRNEQLKYADDSKKQVINTTIKELETKKAAQQTNYNNYQAAALAEKKKNEEANLTANNLNAEQDEFSNLKYNNGFDYKSEQSKNTIATVAPIKEEAKRLKEEAEVALNVASTSSSETEKKELLAKSENLTDQSNRKQEEVARIVETANSSEFYNNQSVISKLKKENTDAYANNTLMAELFIEEAENYFEQAKEAREKAANAPNFTAKQASLQKAYELEMKAIEKQNKAIDQLANGKDAEVIYSSVENENNTNRTNNNELTTNSSNEVATNENTSNQNVTNENIANQNNANEGVNNNEVNTNKTNNETASNETNSSENETNSNGANSRTSDQITEEDKKVIANLGAKEITAVKNSEEFKNYAELKQENRRLVKEAEVEYIEAKVIEQDVDDQKTLGSTLKAMADNASSEEDKAKKVAQIERLNEMIAENEKKASSLKQSAAAKEEEAKTAEDKSNLILINADEKEAKRIAAIEKAELLDNNLIAEAMNRTNNSNENTSNENNTNEANTSTTTNNENSNNETNNEVNTNETASNKNETNTNSTNNEVNSNETASNENNTTETTTNNEVNTNEKASNENETNTNANNTNEINTNETASNETNNESTNNQNNTNESTANNSTEVSTNIDEIPTVLNKSIFVINNNNQSVYNNTKKIPTAAKMPEGLVFKVQIGAFRNEIPQDHFKGFAPIMAEDAGNGITRYTAGLFNSFNVANEAKTSIRSIGYGDAFVVAFLNGKRININEARAMVNEANTPSENNFAVNENTNANNTANNTSTTNTNNNTTTNNTVTTNNQTEEVKDGVSTDVRNIEGIFFTIQVGVYSKQVTAGQLNNVSPINSERTTSGLIRYTSGVYKTLNDANVAKDRIRGLGITDAFVIAYNGGAKITVAQATELLNGGNITSTNTVEETPVEETPVEEAPVEEAPVEETPVEETPVEETPVEETPVEENVLTPKENLNLEFKVKLGEYQQDVPVDEAGIFLKLTSRGIKNYEQDNKTIYTLGSFKEYQKALDLQIEMKEMGVKNPKTMVLKDGNEIPLEEALELMKNNK